MKFVYKIFYNTIKFQKFVYHLYSKFNKKKIPPRFPQQLEFIPRMKMNLYDKETSWRFLVHIIPPARVKIAMQLCNNFQ